MPTMGPTITATVRALDINITATQHGVKVEALPDRLGTWLRVADGEVFISETFLDVAAALYARGQGNEALSALVHLIMGD